ncbi:uncharacterized protein LOC127001124 isoform X6 [Eriocheir sinensis]|uniref:uncharacterized protein LOC127001124 isoform X1 n=1 Tax=Eriocheir sinensis TaxID=95602 RepID=UPI0021C6BC10|nr:uncharacterized protein LOC127001124 isoform X1 [Eriocheir sinensis]XP_050721262.1 uncharacterized protein LOC127001124 isoform X1 [Eriocheir sinensis]XP_050721263.1 uncharacterized protein LOC127001124 isoform X1 [Eriocheir sinensis]XP_050721264.1 uncharacterized protein LOC127001124 isoform X2 [Eriocheir sinensis]XP_050721265.1 uncharacterized protein LOC127001124 isoform X3 [Eriocheir sinensis]XP_050721266.1 uncharacterized protein LOC127001124 isoform X4 [Eriocheir sinensis]XP_05072126
MEEAAGKGRTMGDNPEDCPVCLTNFDDIVQRPRNLPCGHTVCTLCIDKLKEQGRVTCPECRISHAVPEGGQFPVSYIAEALIRMMRDAKVATAALSPPSAGKGKEAAEAADKKEATGFSKKMRSFLQEQEATVVAAITACREARSQLDQYQTTLTGWGERQQHLEDRLQGLVDQSRSARGLVQQEKSRTTAMEVKVKEVEQALQAMQETLHTLKTEQEAGVVVTEVFRCTGEAEQVVQECQECFPDASTVTTARKVREASSAALEAAQAVQAALETPSSVTSEEPRPLSNPAEPRPLSDPAELSSQSHPEELSSQSGSEEPRPQSASEKLQVQSDPGSTIMDRVKLILTLNLKAKDLRSLSQPALSLMQAGRVFAVHQVKGQRRLARISLEAGQLCLHTLKEQHHSLDAATLQVSQLVPPSPPCTVFLDLSWPGSSPRRVQIHLSPDTLRGRQIMMMCTGQRGPSYLNTRLNKVEDKGKPGEWVMVGDLKRLQDGKGASVLPPDLDEGEYWKSGRAGAVHGLVWKDSTLGVCGAFGICTRDCLGGEEPNLVFGEVVDGLHVVAEAAQHSSIMEVTVVDCGMVL